MLRNAFFKSLRDQARALIMWVIGVAFYVALLLSIYPSIRHSAGQLQGYINSLPSAVRAAFLGSGGDFSSPVGYVNTELLSWLAPVVFIAFAVSIAARALAGEEENGTLSLLLTQTIGRRRLVPVRPGLPCVEIESQLSARFEQPVALPQQYLLTTHDHRELRQRSCHVGQIAGKRRKLLLHRSRRCTRRQQLGQTPRRRHLLKIKVRQSPHLAHRHDQPSPMPTPRLRPPPAPRLPRNRCPICTTTTAACSA